MTLVRRRFVSDQPQMRRGSHQAPVDVQIILRHAPRGKAFLETPPHSFARQVSEPIDRADGAIDVLDDEAGHPFLNDLRR